jgi:hypothetical protein
MVGVIAYFASRESLFRCVVGAIVDNGRWNRVVRTLAHVDWE